MLLLTDPANRIFVSHVSLMELAIKYKLNKLPDFIVDLATVIQQLISDGFILIPITENHSINYQHIPLFDEHRDPFDRFLLSIAITEDYILMTSDIKFNLYTTIAKINKFDN